jgi:hypothetical protein
MTPQDHAQELWRIGFREYLNGLSASIAMEQYIIDNMQPQDVKIEYCEWTKTTAYPFGYKTECGSYKYSGALYNSYCACDKRIKFVGGE